jgi:hypothetical protein
VAEHFDFSRALTIMRGGGVVARVAWNGTGLTIGALSSPPGNNLTPFIALRSPEGQFTPWAPSHAEMLSDDWYQVETQGVGHG